MKDKDKLILLFNIPVNGIPESDINEYTLNFANHMSGYFDDSVKCLFSVVRDDTKPAVQAITDFPLEGTDLVLQMEKYIKENNLEELKNQAQAVCDYAKALREKKSE